MRPKQLLAAMVTLIITLCFAGVARAASCDQVVGDDAGLFGSAGTPSVEAAARQLAVQGAFVRVRTTASLPTYDNIPAMIANCPSWKTGTAARNDLLLFVLYRDPSTMKGKANVYAGGRFQSRLNAQWQGIKTNEIGPRFNAGDYPGAAVGGLNGISGALGGTPVAVQPPAPVPTTTQVAPRPSPIVVTPVPAPVPAPPVVTPTPVPSSGGSSTGLWVFLGILVLAGGGAAFYFVRRSKAEAAAKAKAAQQNAKNKATSCATEMGAFKPTVLTILESKVATASKGCSPEDAQKLTALLNALKTRSGEVETQYGRLQQSSNPDDDGKSAGEYASMESAYDKLLTDIDGPKASQSALENKLGEIKRAADQAAPALQTLGKDIETAAADIGDAQKAGFKTGDLESALAEAIADQETATTAIGANRHAAATTTCGTGSTKAKKVSTAAKALATRKSAIEAHAVRVKEIIASAAIDIDVAKKDFAAIQSGFVASSWEAQKNNVTTAASLVASATQNYEAAMRAVGMNAQDWKGAETFLDSAEERIAKAERYADAITTLKQTLQAAKANAPAKLTAARTAVTEANGFIVENAADIEGKLKGKLLQKLQEAEAKLTTEEAMRAQQQPDYLAIVTAAEAVTKVANEVLQSARSDAERTVQLRAEAATAVETAAVGIASATQFVQDNAGTVGNQYDMSIASARTLLASARKQAGNPAQQLELAGRASTTASDVLKSARQVVQNQRRREEEVRQARLAEEQRQREETARLQAEAAEATRQANANTAFVGGVIVGAAISQHDNNGNGGSYDNSSLQSGGGLMGGDDSLDGGSDGSSSLSPAPDLDSGGGGLMGGSDDLSGSDGSSGGESNTRDDDL